MIRATGDFTLKLGNTTWNLHGVYFDSPDPNGNPGYVLKQSPLSQEKVKGAQRTTSASKVLTGTYSLPSGAIAQPKLHLAIVGPKAVAAGQVASYRLTLSRTQPKNRIVYSLKHVQVVSKHAGLRVGHWLLSTLDPDRSRTLRLSVVVPAATRGSFCITANAVAKDARGVPARYCAPVAP